MRLLLALMLCVVGCSPKRVVEREGLVFRTSDATDCQPGPEVETLRLAALGDFPARDALFADLHRGEAWDAIDSFPAETVRLTARGLAGAEEWGAGSVGVFEGDAELLLLPFGRSCPVADPELIAPPTSAFDRLSDGTVVLAGGRALEAGAGIGMRRLLRVAAGSQRAERVDEAMVEPRQAASATATGTLVLIAGGSLGDTGPAYDTFEVYDDVQRALVRRGALAQRRRDHGAVALADGSVLLVGGVGVAGDPSSALDSAERVDPAHGTTESVGSLPSPRASPVVIRLDDGTVLVAAGLHATGAPSTAVLAFDADAFVPALTPSGDALSLPPCVTELVPLVGARAVGFGEGCVSSPLLLRRLPPYIPGSVVVASEPLALAGSLPELEGPMGVGLPDGTLLLEGIDGDTARAFLLDLSRGSVREVEASRAALALVSLGDGAVLELGASGSSLRRELLRTTFDNPPATLLGGLMDGVSAGRPGSFRGEGARIVAERDDARVDLPGLSFRDVRVRLDAPNGGVDVLLLQEGRAPVRVAILSDSFGPALCEVTRVPGEPVTLVRRGDVLEISAGADSKSCTAVGLAQRIGLALVASRGAALGALEVMRLER